MNKFTKVMEAEASVRRYKYTATVQVNGVVQALNESDANQQADNLLGTIPGVDTWEVVNVEETQEAVLESASSSTMSDATAVYVPGRYMGLEDAVHERWALTLSQDEYVVVQVERHNSLNKDQAQLFRYRLGELTATPVTPVRKASK